jgi:chromosome segregation ATPase
MVKRALVTSGVLAMALGFFFGRDAVSYVSTSLGWVKATVKDSVPIEFEIQRARTMIKDLDPEIARNMHLIASEEIQVGNLKEDLASSSKQLEQDRRDVVRLKSDLDRGDGQFVYSGVSYTQKQVESDLSRRFERFKVKEATVEKLQKIVAARESGLGAANEKLKGMQSAKRQLEVEIENLKARLEMVKVAESTSNFNFDDGKLARTRDAIKEIKSRIDVAEKLANANVVAFDQIPLDNAESKNISAEIAKYFNDHPTSDTMVRLESN